MTGSDVMSWQSPSDVMDDAIITSSSSHQSAAHTGPDRLLPCPVPWRVDLLHCPLTTPAMLYHALLMTSSSAYGRPPCACALCCTYVTSAVVALFYCQVFTFQCF